MAQVTHKVVWGDTLSALAVKYGTTVSSIAALNNIKNIHRIYVGQVLVIKNKTVSSGGGGSTSSPTPTNATITSFGLQSNTDSLIFAIWTWSRSNTEHYEVEWSYYTDNGIWFNGSTSTVNINESTYTAPNNAVKVRFRVKPISSKYKDKKGNEVSYWTAAWTGYKEYSMSDNPPDVPPVPTVEVDKYTMTMSNTNLDINANEVQYQIVQNDSNVFNTGIVSINTGSSAYSVNITPGHKYKVRARGKRGNIYGAWSDYTTNYISLPNAPSGIKELTAITDTAVRLTWDSVPSATKYSIQHAEKEVYFEGSNGVTTIDNIETTSYIITGLTKGTRYYFRLRSVNDAGNSSWSSSKTIALGSKPEPPSTWSDRTIAIIGDKVLLSWIHNSVDGSDQTLSEIEFQVNGETDTHQIGMDINGKPINTFEMPTFMHEDGTKVYWRVRTKGVTAEFSDWSIQRVIDIHSPPTLMLRLTDILGVDIDVVNKFPFKLYATPDTNGQKPISYFVSIKSKQSYVNNTPFGEVNIKAGDEIFSEVFTIQEGLILTLHAGNIDLENNIEYEITCGVTMNTGLSTEQKLLFTVDWSDVESSPNAELLIDTERLSASIRPYCERYETVYMKVEVVDGRYIETSEELEDFQNGVSVDGAITNNDRQVYKDMLNRYFCILDDYRVVEVKDVTLSIYRRTYDGKFVEIATGIDGNKNTFITDPHPSLDYARYRIVSSDNATGAISYIDINSQYIGDPSIVIQWDESWSNFIAVDDNLEDVKYTGGSMVKLPYNINISENNAPDVSTVNYIGREHPVSYYGTNLGVTSTWSTVIEKDDVELLHAIRRLSMYMGDVYVREPSGIGYWANIKVSYDKSYDSLVIPITFNITRVEGGV